MNNYLIWYKIIKFVEISYKEWIKYKYKIWIQNNLNINSKYKKCRKFNIKIKLIHNKVKIMPNSKLLRIFIQYTLIL